MTKDLPEGWASIPLEDVTTSIQYGYTASAEPNAAGPRFLRITDIQDGKVDWSTVPSCKITKEELVKYSVRPGDIVFARSGATTGKSFLIESCPEAVFASYLIRVRARCGVVDPKYLALSFQTPAYWAYITDSLAGNAQPNCNGSKLAAMPVLVAPLREQLRIVQKVESLFRQVERVASRLTQLSRMLGGSDAPAIKTDRIRQAILLKAFSGDLVVTEADLARVEGRTFETAMDLFARLGSVTFAAPQPKKARRTKPEAAES